MSILFKAPFTFDDVLPEAEKLVQHSDISIELLAIALINTFTKTSVAEAASFFPQVLGQNPKFQSESTLKRHLKHIQQSVDQGVARSLDEAKCQILIKGVLEMMRYAAEKELGGHLNETELENVQRDYDQWFEIVLERFPQNRFFIRATYAFTLDLMLDHYPQNEVLWNKKKELISSLKSTISQEHTNVGHWYWIYYNHLLTKKHRGDEFLDGMKQLASEVKKDPNKVNNKLMLDILLYADGWEAAMAYGEPFVRNSKKPLDPSFLYNMATFYIRARSPRKALKLLKDVIQRSHQRVDYFEGANKLADFCAAHFNDNEYKDEDVPDEAILS